MTEERIELGQSGEARVAHKLEAEGWLILARNWRCRAGELDLVASRSIPRGKGTAQLIAFVEVKTRRGGLAPKLSVTRAKRRRLVRLARWFLKELGWRAVVGRFDVAEVVWSRAEEDPEIVIHAGVFDATGRARR